MAEHYCTDVVEAVDCPTCKGKVFRRYAPRILAHPIGGGWDLRHEGCAPKCCEDEAEVVDKGWDKRTQIGSGGHLCSGCGETLAGPPGPMEFDRNMACDAHFHDEHCTCPDCIRQHMAQEIL